ncbi:MAG: class I tRNA ligase family protein [Clostridia bacterium]|nr:class I tRNA ligase family protein [Deltaproteobacteria bacterium]
MSDAQAAKPEKSDPYRATLNLPVTNFAMKANLAIKEPQIQERWSKHALYEKLRERESPRGPFVFHDGPPYANGPIHIGHLLNKILKDLVVRSHVMRGFDVDYVPGWDCHGLPIEHKVLKDLGAKARELSTIEVRKLCHDSAASFIGIQATQMQRLGTLANYAHPYRTMDPQFEAATLEVFALLVERQLVYRDLKPVHWSIANRTALADAELEYKDRTDPSIYAMFPVVSGLPASLNATCPVDLMIWTTTPWTLPANLAVAVAPSGCYGLYEIPFNGSHRQVVLVEQLHAKVLAAGGVTEFKKLGECSGTDLTSVVYKHPFIERTSPVLTADYVTFEDGTGLVHTAPGHGVEDYQTGLRNKLAIYCPVLANGTYDDTVPAWLRAPGIDVWKANPLVIDQLRASGHLFHWFEFTHSYPHDWRSKTPVIFRATEQWFIGVDKPFALAEAGAEGAEFRGSAGSMRERALQAA